MKWQSKDKGPHMPPVLRASLIKSSFLCSVPGDFRFLGSLVSGSVGQQCSAGTALVPNRVYACRMLFP